MCVRAQVSDQSENWYFAGYGRSMLDSVPPNAVIISKAGHFYYTIKHCKAESVCISATAGRCSTASPPTPSSSARQAIFIIP